MMRFRVDLSIIHPRFLVQVLQTPELKSQILGRAKRAVLSSAAKRSALALDSLFASLQHQAFNGEL